jgi:hypothetical protein
MALSKFHAHPHMGPPLDHTHFFTDLLSDSKAHYHFLPHQKFPQDHLQYHPLLEEVHQKLSQ